MRLPLPILAGIAAGALAAGPAGAATICDHGDPSWGYGVHILSVLDTINQVGDPFTLPAPATLEQVEWWGVQGGTDFDVRIFETVAGVPAATPLADWDVVATGTEQTFFGQDYLHYLVTVPSLALDPGTYLLSIVGTDEASSWFWAASCEDGCEGLSWRRAVDGEAWDVGNFTFAFLLHGSGAGLDAPVVERSDDVIRVAPNPFATATNLAFDLPRRAHVTLDLHDVRGTLVRRLVDGEAAAGSHAVTWDGTDGGGRRVAAGAYLYRLHVEGRETTGRIVLLR